MGAIPENGDKGTATRARGRPSPDAAAKIDREILQVAREQFFANGYEGTSMAMVVKAAGVSKTTLYARYATKADLFRATVMLTIDRIANGTLSTAERRSTDLKEGLNVFGRDALKISISALWSKYERLIFAEGPRFPELTEAVAQRVDIGIQTVARFIVTCAERDGIPCRDAEAVATVYVMAIRGYYTAAVLRAVTLTDDECRDFIATLVTTLLAGRANW